MIKRLARQMLPPRLWRWMRTWRMKRILAKFQPFTVTQTYDGFPLSVRITDPLAQGWYAHDWPEMAEMRLLSESKLRENATVFDIGAHQGIVAMILARRVGSQGKVVVVEPLPHNVAALQENLRLNGISQVKVEQGAISNQIGELEIALDLNSQVRDSATTIQTIQVPALTVDQLSERHGYPQVLFIDVEGYECHALEGATGTLARRPDCFVEVHRECGLERAGRSIADVFRFFPSDLHRMFAWTESSPLPQEIHGPHDCPTERFFMVAIPLSS